MDTTILEVVLGLALVYALLAVLVMKLQEEVGGNALNYRAHVLHDLLAEATGGDAGLKQRVLQNPLVSALYRGNSAEQKSVLRDTGPSAIPPTVFAQALLAELNGGTAPALAYSTPSAFFSARAPSPLNTETNAASAEGSNLRTWRALQLLLPGHEGDWTGFQAAIAQWFSDIGDRADGWFKRKASRWTLAVSVVLVVGLNADSMQIASTLATDPALRLGLADLAQRVDAQRRSDAASAPDAAAPASLAAQPMQQVASRMTDAITRLNSAWRSDKAIGLFKADMAPIRHSCGIVRDGVALADDEAASAAATGAAPPASAASAAPPPPRKPLTETEREKARAAAEAASAAAAERARATVVDGQLNANAMLSNADIWLRVLPELQSRIEVAQLQGASDAARTWRRSYACVAQVSAWVRTAVAASNDASVRGQMLDAASALESVKSALLVLAERQQASTSLNRAFISDPEAFADCARQSRSRSGFDACLQRALRSGFNLPLLWGGATMRQQFCSVASGRAGVTSAPQQISLTITLPDGAALPGRPGASAAAVATALPLQLQPPPQPSWLCGTPAFAGDARLDLPALRLEARPGLGPWLVAAAGWAVTVLFVALGAPFWFDLLARVVRMRSAGTVRDATADAERGRGTLPLPAPAAGGGGAAAAAGRTPVADGSGAVGAGPFPDSRNRFEDGLQVADVIRLQQRLGVTASGRLDGTTRAAIATWCRANAVSPVVEELDDPLFLRIVGRPALQSAGTAGAPRLQLGQIGAAVPQLASLLMPVLRQPGRIDPGKTVFDADLRALAVLFRYHHERANGAGPAPKDCLTLQLAHRRPLQLEVDEALQATIAEAAAKNQRITLEPPCWMDWAIGELGQVENDARGRTGSNPRILAYLDAAQANAGDNGDHTPWCGAFVAWVLKSYDDYRREYHKAHPNDTERSGDPLAAAGSTWALPQVDLTTYKGWPLTAADWIGWGTPRANWRNDARFGDVVLLKSQGAQSSGHVGFFIACDDHHVWLLGGNQTGGSRVSMQAWNSSEVKAVLHAQMPPAPSPTPAAGAGQVGFDPAI